MKGSVSAEALIISAKDNQRASALVLASVLLLGASSHPGADGSRDCNRRLTPTGSADAAGDCSWHEAITPRR